MTGVVKLQVDKLVCIFVCLWIKEETEEPGICGQHRKKCSEKGFLPDQDADNDDFFLATGIQGVAGKGLADIAFVFVNSNMVIVLITERAIVALVDSVVKL